MKSIYAFIFLACVLLVPAQHAGARIPGGNQADTLIPPGILTGFAGGCDVFLLWSPPLETGGTLPPGIMGYYIYGNGRKIGFSAGMYNVQFYHLYPKPGEWVYSVTAYYDLSYYGQPGKYGESDHSMEKVIVAGCDMVLPFTEPWDMGVFQFNSWHFSPDQGNWIIDIQSGDPAPCAVFKGDPGLTCYQSSLISTWMPMEVWTCASIPLSFDLKLENVNPTGNEKLILEATPDSVWETIATISNKIDTGWIHYEYEFSKYGGEGIMFRFRATGQNSQDIKGWYLDNIKIDPYCLPPTGGKAVRQNNNINRISWVPPCTKNLNTSRSDSSILMGFNIYRSDSSGKPPFTKLNTTLVTDTVYYDTLPAGLHSNYFSYYLTTRFNESGINVYLCESPPGDTLKVTSLSVTELSETEVLVYPNPSSADIIIKGAGSILGCEIWNTAGQIVDVIRSQNSKELKVNVSGLAPGLYFLRIQTGKGIINRKLIR
ncbi:MAG: T9SS type A sorting domain-containing protein [Bacteroidetes bacterium]|nr:T9SS type A sorting domain-containing protein [Bacteroidota bacterium]